MILLITSPNDAGASALMQELARQGREYRRFDYAEFPMQAQLGMQLGSAGVSATLRLADGDALDLDDVGSLWFGRPEVMNVAVQGATERQFVHRESLEALGGLWQINAGAWINHPVCSEIASRKPYQLAMARRCGLVIPQTLITNDAGAAREFIAALGVGRVVHKTFVAAEDFWRETRLVKPSDLELLDAVQVAPVIFQEFIDGDDIRVTIIGDQVHAAAIRSGATGERIDYRIDLGDCAFDIEQLPEALCKRLVAFVRSLNLVYGAVDLRRTPAGDYVFLEINPCGQWWFVESRTGLPIAQGLAEELGRFAGS